MNPLHHLTLAALLLLPPCLASCSHGTPDTTATAAAADSIPAEAEVTAAITIAPRDSDIYLMGRRHAAYMLNHSSHPDTICARLLEMRARETDIRTRVDADAAAAYIHGISTYIKENDTALADTLFGHR
ncbi:MAG: hypothetical protein NC193_10150 [bacterium]|nr:hypothetical protein [bacterium]